MKRLLNTIILCMVGLLTLHAQDSDFNPANPPDPSGDFKYTVTVSAIPAGSTSGTGRYLPGTNVTIRTSPADEYYIFKHWLKDDVVYETRQNFTYTTEAKSVHFVAVYEYVFDPSNPADPQEDFRYSLILTSNDPEACSYNIAAKSRHKPDEKIAVRCYPSSGYPFEGWYEDGKLLSKATSFQYTMPSRNATLEAHFGSFNPDNPDDPWSQGGSIDNYLLGDADDDGDVDQDDIETLQTIILYDPVNLHTGKGADANEDRTISIADIATTIKIVQTEKKQSIIMEKKNTALKLISP